MTRCLIALTLLLALIGPSAALAQTETAGPTWMLGVNAGVDLPMGDFKDAYKSAFTIGGSAAYMFTDKYGLELGLEWSKFDASDDLMSALEEAAPGETVDATFQFLPVTVDFVEYFPVTPRLVPYVKGGLGIYFETAELEVSGKKDRRTDNDFGFNLAGGVKIPIQKMVSIDAGVRFHNVMTEDQSTQYFTFTAGLGVAF